MFSQTYKEKREKLKYIISEKMLQPKFGRSMKKNRIMVGYDNWSGVFILHMPGIHTKSSDRVIKKIYVYLSASELNL